jgi:hypothetical protein
MAVELDTRAELAELELLASYDAMRERAGYDYGAGQRAGELRRRRLRLEARGIDRDDAPAVELAELEQAWRRIAVPRMRRLELEQYRADTPATRRTLETWRRLERVYGFGAHG